MPELPDIEDYLAALEPRILGARLQRARVRGISLLKTFDPPLDDVEGRVVDQLRRLGKRIVWRLSVPPRQPADGDQGSGDRDPQQALWSGDRDPQQALFVVLHLMIAGRLRWAGHGAKVPGRIGLAAFDFSTPGDLDAPGGSLLLTEAGTKKRASLHVVRGEEALAEHDRGGIDPIAADREAFVAAMTAENRTLKRALTDPRRLSGIGNAFSDEILHRARLSPVQRTRQLDDEQLARLHDATREVLDDWVARLREVTGTGFPDNVTAFRDDFAVHGRYGRPCPVCTTEVQRIRYADNETNYCPRCQTGGKVLADRSLSRLLKDDWPRNVDQLEGS